MRSRLYGWSLCIYKKGEVREKYFGYKEVFPNIELVDRDTLYDIASLTKTYTAVLIFIASEEGMLSIDDTVYNIDNNFVNLDKIKVKDLLSHNQEIWTKSYIADVKTKEEYLSALYSSYVKSNKPTYVDVDYMILSYILEKVYNTEFSKLLEEKIIKRLNLTNTTFDPVGNIASTNFEKTIDSKCKLGEIHDKKARLLKNIGITVGHAGLFTTGLDLLKFLMAILNNEILKKETVDLMLKYNEDNVKKYNYNYRIYNYMGSRCFNKIKKFNDVPKSGKIFSFNGYTGPRYIIDFDNEIIIVLMCNIVHNTKLERPVRFSIAKNFIYNIYNEVLNECV